MPSLPDLNSSAVIYSGKQGLTGFNTNPKTTIQTIKYLTTAPFIQIGLFFQKIAVECQTISRKVISFFSRENLYRIKGKLKIFALVTCKVILIMLMALAILGLGYSLWLLDFSLFFTILWLNLQILSGLFTIEASLNSLPSRSFGTTFNAFSQQLQQVINNSLSENYPPKVVSDKDIFLIKEAIQEYIDQLPSDQAINFKDHLSCLPPDVFSLIRLIVMCKIIEDNASVPNIYEIQRKEIKKLQTRYSSLTSKEKDNFKILKNDFLIKLQTEAEGTKEEPATTDSINQNKENPSSSDREVLLLKDIYNLANSFFNFSLGNKSERNQQNTIHFNQIWQEAISSFL